MFDCLLFLDGKLLYHWLGALVFTTAGFNFSTNQRIQFNQQNLLFSFPPLSFLCLEHSRSKIKTDNLKSVRKRTDDWLSNRNGATNSHHQSLWWIDRESRDVSSDFQIIHDFVNRKLNWRERLTKADETPSDMFLNSSPLKSRLYATL